ncbi:MAG: oligosaccharide flippase family protein [Planctomycetota bacterium]
MTTTPEGQAPGQQATGVPAVGQAAFRGAVWMFAQSVLGKAVMFLGNIVLAWLLVPEDFGLFGIAAAVIVFTNLLSRMGILQILTTRQDEYDRLANPAFWCSATVGLCVMGAVALLAPVLASVYEEERLANVVLLLAFSGYLELIRITAEAQLHIALRFRALATLDFFAITTRMALLILFALGGFGVYAFALAPIVVNVVRGIVVFRLCPVPIRLRPEVRMWRTMLGDMSLLLVGAVMAAVISNADYLIIGRLLSPEAVGIYFFAFTQSMQTFRILSVNLGSVLFPALSKVRDDAARQVRGVLTSARLLLLVGTPMCVAQVVLADPLVRVVFEEEWLPAIPVIQILSVGLAMRMTSVVSRNLVIASRRMRTHAIAMTGYALAFVIAVTAGTLTGGVLGASVGVAVFGALLGPIDMLVACVPLGAGPGRVLNTYVPPLVVGVGGFLPAWFLSGVLPESWSSWMTALPRVDETSATGLLRAACTLGLGAPMYLLLARLLCPRDLRSIVDRVRNAARREAR